MTYLPTHIFMQVLAMLILTMGVICYSISYISVGQHLPIHWKLCVAVAMPRWWFLYQGPDWGRRKKRIFLNLKSEFLNLEENLSQGIPRYIFSVLDCEISFT